MRLILFISFLVWLWILATLLARAVDPEADGLTFGAFLILLLSHGVSYWWGERGVRREGPHV
jgi:hypothetical protein